MPPASAIVRRAVSSRAALCAAVALAAAGAPANAHAQFGRLRDAAKAAARGVADQTAGKRAGEAVAPQAGADGPAEASSASVAFTDGVLEITEERLAQLVRGLDAEVAARPAAERRYAAQAAAAREAERTLPARRAAYERDHAAWDQRRLAIEACAAKAEGRHAGEVDAQRADAEDARKRAEAQFSGGREAQLKALGERARAAQARGDQAAMMALADSAQRIMRNEILPVANAGMALAQRAEATGRAMRAEAAACGALPPEPKAPAGAGSLDPDGAGAGVRKAGREASGLTERQYDVMRERVEEYARLGGRPGATRYRFTPRELGVLGPRLGALKGNAALQGGASWTPGA